VRPTLRALRIALAFAQGRLRLALANDLDPEPPPRDIDEFLADIRSDAFRYLHHRAATTRDRYSSFIRLTAKVAAEVETAGRWEEQYEWRIATDGRHLLEKLGAARYRARTEDHGIFEVEFASFADAYEAVHAFSSIQHDLFYALGWDSWAGRGQMEPGDPPDELEPVEEEHSYFVRLSDEARADAASLAAGVEAALADGGTWSEPAPLRELTVDRRIGRDGAWYRVDVSCRSLVMTGHSPTVERALEFGGIYARLQADLAHYLAWDWL